MSNEAVEVEQVAESTELQPQPEATEQPAPSAGAEPETHDEPEKSAAEDEEKSQKGINRRFAKLSAKVAALEEERDHWRTQALGKAEPAKPDAPKAKPKAEDFDSTEAYLDARDEWIRKETLKEARAELEKQDKARTQQSEVAEAAADWQEKETAATEKHEDYEEVTATAMDALQASKGPAQAAIAHALQFSDAGPELLYYLGQHPEEVAKLAGQHPTAAVIALGRIEARLAADNPGERTPPPQTRAPKPPTPVRKPTASRTLDPDNPEDAERMTAEEWAKAREAKLNRR